MYLLTSGSAMLALVTMSDSVSIDLVTVLPPIGGQCLLDALLADVVGLLGDQRLHVACLELLDLVGAGVEADDLDLAGLSGLLDAGGDALRGEQVRREDTGEVGVLASAAEMICAAVLAWLWEYCGVADEGQTERGGLRLEAVDGASTLETPGRSR